MAKLPAPSAMVLVGPPLFCSSPSFSCVSGTLLWLVPLANAHEASVEMLKPWSVIGGPEQLLPLMLAANIVLFNPVEMPGNPMTMAPLAVVALLPEKVLLVTATGPLKLPLLMPPPKLAARLPEKVLVLTFSVPPILNAAAGGGVGSAIANESAVGDS